MKRTRELDNILDECLERILARGETIEQCLARNPEVAAELQPLLNAALVTHKAINITPRAEFKERARYQFQAALREREERQERRVFGWQPRWATVVITALVVFLLGGGGTVAAATNSMPGETLYPVKIASEEVRLVLTTTNEGKADLYIKLADDRMAEISKMADKGSPEFVERAAERMNRQIIAAAALAAPQNKPPAQKLAAPARETAGAAEEAPKALTATENKTFITEDKTTKVAPRPVVPAPAPVPPQFGAVRSSDSENKTRTPVKDFSTSDKREALKVTIARKALENPEALRKALERAPDSVKPALRRALAQSEQAYKQALESLEE